MYDDCMENERMTKDQAVYTASIFASVAAYTYDEDVAAEVFPLVADFINYANGHPTWLG